jgi:outer membrane protein TolC
MIFAMAAINFAAGTVGCASKRPMNTDTLVETSSASSSSPYQTAAFKLDKPGLEANTSIEIATNDTLVNELDVALQRTANQLDLPIVSASSDSLASATPPHNATELPDNLLDLTESEMLSIAMGSSPVLRPLGVRILENPESVTTMVDPAIAASDPFFGPQAALAAFDSQLSASLSTQNNDRVFNNTILGGDVQELTQDFSTANAGLQKRTLSGATVNLGAVHQYDNNNRDGNRFRSYWETQYEASIRQPLLQGAGHDFNLIAGPNARPGFNFSNGLVIARLNVKVTEADFEIEVRDFVRDLYSAYWGLQQQYLNVQNIQVSKEVAYQTWQSVLAKRSAKMTGGEANKEAQARARYYSFVRQLQTALGGDGGQAGLYASERNLRRLMGMPIVDQQLLHPIDEAPQVQFSFDFEDLASRAIGQRTELLRQSIRVQQEEQKLIAAKNFLLPQLDMIGRYRMRGFGDDLMGDGDRFASAYDDLLSMDHQEWEFGVEMGVAAGRRQAHAAVRNASLQVRRERTVFVEQQRTVRHQIADAHAEVASSYAALEASMAQVEAATERLEASQAQFKADKIQIEFLLDAQEELLRAQTQFNADTSRYAIALINIGTASGSLLDDVGIQILRSGCGNQLFHVGR